MQPLIIGHRGARLAARENTPEAIRAAMGMGADWVEVDVRLTADGRPVLCHDERHGGREVARTALRELSLPTLADGLEAAAGMGVNLELKGPSEEPERIVEVVAEALRVWAGDLLVSSFWPPLLTECRRRLPEAPLGVLTAHHLDPEGAIAISYASEHRLSAVVVEDQSVGGDLVDEAHQRGLRVFAWTVNDPARIRLLSRWGVDAVITDDPAGALTALGRGRLYQ